jgi:hypothetical protein
MSFEMTCNGPAHVKRQTLARLVFEKELGNFYFSFPQNSELQWTMKEPYYVTVGAKLKYKIY